MTGPSTPSSSDGDTCVRLRLPHAAASVRRARHQLVASLAAEAVDPDTAADAALVVSELVTNAVEHGRPTASGQVEVTWCVGDGRVEISVYDAGDAREIAAQPLTNHRAGGRGLAIVESLCDSWRADQDGGLRVTAELRYGS